MCSNKYVGDIIQPSDYRKWTNDNIILITAPTGSGKNTFIRNQLQSYANAFHEKILLFSNRNVLKNQNIRIIGDGSIITTMNYQQLENMIHNNVTMLYKFDYIVIDECHYFFNDSSFNRNTDLSLKWLFEQQAIKILMSATTDIIRDYLDDKGLPYSEYKIVPDYSYIDNFFFYNSDKVIEKLLLDLPAHEKVIYFASLKKAYNISKEYKSSFICSKNNKQYAKYSDNTTKKSIIKTEKFESQILCSTTVIDNGVNIKDPQVKHIIIDYFDLDTIQQCIGRKRIDGNEKINVYIKNRKNGDINRYKQLVLKGIRQSNYLREAGEIEFTELYTKRDTQNIIDTVVGDDGLIHRQVNEIIYIKNKKTIERCNRLMDTKDGFIEDVKERFGISYTKILDNELDEITFNNKMRKYINIKIFKNEQKEFKQFLLKECFNAPKGSHGKLGLKTINGFFEDNNLNYKIESKKERSKKSDNCNQRYWIIKSTS